MRSSLVSPLAVKDAAEGNEQAYNAAVAEWGADDHNLAGQSQPPTNPTTVSFAEIRQLRDTAGELRLSLAQRAVLLLRQYVELQSARLPVARAAHADAETALTKTEKSVATRLNKAGVSVQSQVAWPKNHHAAEAQFAYQVKQSADYRAGLAAVKDAATFVQATHDAADAGRKRLANAEKVLADVINQLLGLPLSETNLPRIQAA